MNVQGNAVIFIFRSYNLFFATYFKDILSKCTSLSAKSKWNWKFILFYRCALNIKINVIIHKTVQ